MDNNLNDEFFGEEEHSFTPTKKRKIWLEITDILAGCAFPLIIMVVFSSSIIMFAVSDTVDIVLRLIALIGGELLLGVAWFVFGRTNGSEAYKKTVENARKRELNSSDEKVYYHTGEYALWKGLVIGLIVCVPFLIVLTVQVCASNSVCSFLLQYAFAWGYAPFTFFGEVYVALGYVAIIYPVAVMTVGYYFGKRRQIKIQEQLAKTNPDDKRSRIVDVPDDKKNKRRKK